MIFRQTSMRAVRPWLVAMPIRPTTQKNSQHVPWSHHIRHASSSSETPSDAPVFDDHSLNCDGALMKDAEGRKFSDLIQDDIGTLQGLGPNALSAFDSLGVKTVKDLATYKYYLLSKSIATLAETEKNPDGRLKGSVMNIDKAVDKPYRTMSFHDITDAPVAALFGLSEEKGALLKAVGVTSVGDLATLKYCRWAESMVILSKYEK